MSIDNRGYSLNVVQANIDASTDSLGVQLGRYCISRDLPAQEIADYFNVSKMTVYRWFDGTRIPRDKHKEKIMEMLQLGGVDGGL